ncbi:MAG: MBL fold metallo-hydrolase [Clostridia bacterium]|nr:MBL fold metallo-hydrolase [Clostridia bacterium]
MAKKKKKFSKGLTVFLAVVCFLAGTVGGFYGYFKLTLPTDSDSYVSGDLVINFLELGNKYTGDCTYIKAGETDILIDAGSKTSSVSTIDAFLKDNVTDGVLEYVIVTHAHEDHYAGFATNENADSIFDLYECEVIIDFSQITSGKESQKMYKNYIRERDAEIEAGAVHYTAEECMTQGKNVFDLGSDIELEILDSYFYYNVSDTENDHSVCCIINQGDRHFLFTGDLEKEGEEKLVEMNELPEVTLYKAGHHGSKTSSNDVLLSVIKPEIVCVCCCCGSSEYTDTEENQFPTQAFIDRIAPYTDKVYVTTLCVDYDNDKFKSMNGNISVISGSGEVKVECGASDTLLKDSEWFKASRTCPDEWKK